MRQKRRPVRRPLETDDEGLADSEVLGRSSLPSSQSLDYMLAGEIAGDVKEKQAEYRTAPSEPSAMPPTLAEIERQIAAREREKVSKSGRKKTLATKTRVRRSKNVHFSKERSERLLQIVKSEIIPPPELVIERCQERAICTEQHRLLRFCPRKALVPTINQENSKILSSFILPSTEIILSEEPFKESPRVTSNVRHPIVSGIAVRDLWAEFDLPSEILAPVLKCVQEGWIQLLLYHEKKCDAASLLMLLESRAFTACRNLPFVQNRRQWKKYNLANCLQQIIKVFYDIPQAPPFYSRENSMDDISAKYIYDLVDNKSLQRYEADEKKKKMSWNIPGLIPTLRPYQGAAVQWMLEREKMKQPGDEWKVIWTLLEPKTRTRKPLVEVMQDNAMAKSQGLYYCAFNGKVARSIDEAKQLTLLGHDHPIKGGILADQMGLGKTVEVLACVLAHPLPNGNQHQKEPSCRRRLFFDNEDDLFNEDGHNTQMADTFNYNDSTHQLDDNGENMIRERTLHVSTVAFPSASTSPLRFIEPRAIVTPETIGERVEERWIEDVDVGSCICGAVISFKNRQQNNMFAYCDVCEEPMHLACTCFGRGDVEKLPHLNLRRMFGNEVLRCVRCKSCPCCAMRNAPIRSRATIIICPPSILDQWKREISRHTNQMKILVYDGVEKQSKRTRRDQTSMRLLHPAYLADADIILVSFTALMSDLSHSEENRFISQSDSNGWAASNLRRKKKYRIVPSPLLSIHFWRICIDEAQRVEVTTTKAAKMALKLKGDHFWAVSGTPIGHGKLQDLYGLFLFLQLAPFDHPDWFHSCLSPTMDGFDERIQLLLRDVFWRSTKELKMVKEQIGIPEMEEKRIVLKFSSIERHFYNRQLQKTLQLADDLGGTKNTLGKRKSTKFDFISDSLHRLRAACCHPQVGSSGLTGGRRVKSRKISSKYKREVGNGVASRVMTMEQILDRFIDDARHKCEEAQRIAILHTNGMGALTRLKVEARSRGVSVDHNDRSLFVQSGKLYREALVLAQKNANPVRATAEATLDGSAGLWSPGKKFQNGRCCVVWKNKERIKEHFATIEYGSSSRRITKVLVRPIIQIPTEINQSSKALKLTLVNPVSVTLQAATMATGEEFVDCAEVSLGNSWVELDNVSHTRKSKMWRVVVKTSDHEVPQTTTSLRDSNFYVVGIEVEFYEPQINSDDLQLLHSLHNACLSFEAALEIPSPEANDEILSVITSMKQEIVKIECVHKGQAQVLHRTCMFNLKELSRRRQEKEKQLYDATSLSKPRSDVLDCWDDGWYDDFLGMVSLFGSEGQHTSILNRIIEDVEAIYNPDETMKFPDFSDISGLRTALSMRLSKIRCDGLGKKHTVLPATTADNEFVQIRSERFKCGKGEHHLCIDSISNLSSRPEAAEIFENSHCRLCKADWNQTGKICRHCDIANVLQDLRPDSVTMKVLTGIHASMKTSAGTALLNSKHASHIADRAKFFFEVLEAEEREKVGAWRMWRVHLDLLNGLDELSSCKKGIRMSFEDEDLTLYTEEQLNAIVHPTDVFCQYHDHAAKQAMALGDLRQSTGVLRYLQNQKQSIESTHDSTTETCVVCLQPLDGECAVLKCGHRFHQKHCFDQILKKSGPINVHCPLRCRLQTPRSDVMIATNRARDDGSNTMRKVKGSYGTKITRIISDILDIREKGEKGVIFSQWHDMLDIIEVALTENHIGFARPHGGNRFRESLLAFQSPNCTVLLLNLKQGAEGLTLVQATHVFMVEPVMNNGLDQQAINRIHRIGQTRRTFVWRYLIEESIEMKLDKMRKKHEDSNDVLEDTMNSSRSNSVFSAGGIDGGFTSHEELLEILDAK